MTSYFGIPDKAVSDQNNNNYNNVNNNQKFYANILFRYINLCLSPEAGELRNQGK